MAIKENAIKILQMFETEDELADQVLGLLSGGMFDEWDCSLTQGIELGFGGDEFKIAAKSARLTAEFVNGKEAEVAKRIADFESEVPAPCVLCGESTVDEEDKGEMHGEEQDRYGNAEYGTVTRGLVHAQCGLDHDWEVS